VNPTPTFPFLSDFSRRRSSPKEPFYALPPHPCVFLSEILTTARSPYNTLDRESSSSRECFLLPFHRNPPWVYSFAEGESSVPSFPFQVVRSLPALRFGFCMLFGCAWHPPVEDLRLPTVSASKKSFFLRTLEVFSSLCPADPLSSDGSLVLKFPSQVPEWPSVVLPPVTDVLAIHPPSCIYPFPVAPLPLWAFSRRVLISPPPEIPSFGSSW